MSDMYKRFAIVVADLDRIEISNEDPMRYSKRCCLNAARTALEEGIRRADEMLRMVQNIHSDAKEIIEGAQE